MRGLSSGARSLCSPSLSSCTSFHPLDRELRRALRANDLREQLEKVNEKGRRLIERAAYTCAGIVALGRAREKQRDQTEVRAESVWLRGRGRVSEGARAFERSSVRAAAERRTSFARAPPSISLFARRGCAETDRTRRTARSRSRARREPTVPRLARPPAARAQLSRTHNEHFSSR